ncbi:MAG: putative small lipoprotein YifL [Arenicella sp.]|jgi:predicted small lipoprotein YifL
MNTTAKKSPNTNLSTLLRTSLVVIALAALSGCGQKGPLILERVPVDETQGPIDSAAEQVPVEASTVTPEEPQQAPKAD